MINKYVINEYNKDYINKKYYDQICVILDIINKVEYKLIINKKYREDNNLYIDNEYRIVCFTIDLVVGINFYNMLKKLIVTYLKNKYDDAKVNNKFLEFIKFKRDKILVNVKKYIISEYFLNNNIDKYIPSELTEYLVNLYGSYNKHEYKVIDSLVKFEEIQNMILSSDDINEDEPLIKYLRIKFMPYFDNYYSICIKNLFNVINSFENLIQSQYISLEIIKTIIKNINNFEWYKNAS